MRLRILVAIAVLASAPLLAQVSTGSIGGTISDPSGGAIPEASVTARNEQTGATFQTLSSIAGLYVLPSLPTGMYEVTVEKIGFKKMTRSGLEIRVATRVALDIPLEVGDVQQTVEVVAEAPLLETTTSERGQSFSAKFMNTLPLFTGGVRNPEAFVTYMPGVNSHREVSINGSGGRGKEVLIDGASLIIPESGGVVFNFPAAEMFGEFKLITGTYSAEHGRFGGGIESCVTKSGTNSLHGTGFWNLRRDIFNAAGYNINSNVNNKPGFRPKERFNEVGGAIGGPVYIPKAYDGRNKTFFFLSYSRDLRPATATSTTSAVATAQMKQGDFSQFSRLIYDPATTAGNTREAFTNNTIPQARFSSVASKILPSIPDPNLPGVDTANYSFVNSSNLTDYHWSLKLDHAFTDKNRLSYFHSLQNQDTAGIAALPGPLGQALGSSFQRPQNFRVNHDYIFSPTFLMHTTFGYSRTRQGWDNPAQAGFASQIGLKTDTDATPRIRFAAADALTAFGVQDGKVNDGRQYNTTYHYSQAMTWIKGRHEFKFGWDARRLQTTGDDAAGTNGLFNFARAQTALPTNTAGTGHSFASFLLGAPDSAETAALPILIAQIRYTYHAGYIMDNWKLTPKLTLNLGLRYEVPIGFHFKENTFSSISLTAQNPAADNRPGALTFAGEGQGRIGAKRFYPTDYSSIGPRIGFAYQLTSKTVLRGGYGIFYQTLGNGGCGCTLGFGGPPTQVPSDGLNGAFPLDGGIPVPPNVAKPPFIDPSFGNFRDVDYLGPNFGQAPRVHNWSINVQHEFAGFLADIAYVGNRGSGLNSSIWLNQVDPKYLSYGALLRKRIDDPEVIAAGFSKPFAAFPNDRTLAQALRPYPQYLNVFSRNSGDGRTWYDSMQAKLERRFGAWQMMTSYTFSKSLAKIHYRQIFTQFEVAPQNTYDLDAEKTYSSFDIPHVFNVLNSVDLPFGRGRRWLNQGGVVDYILGGWTIAAAQRYVSGGLDVGTAPNSLGNVLFNGGKRANPTGQELQTGVNRTDLDPANADIRYFNSGAFALAGEFELGYGSLYYGDLRRPPVFQENLSIQKQFRLFNGAGDHGVLFTYRADMFNLFNRTNFTINSSIGNANFGRATAPQNGPRLITMGLRLEF
jgi:hypothetical protein